MSSKDRGVEPRVMTDGGVNKDRFQIEVNDEVTLARDDLVAHIDHGPMHVEQISVGPSTKYARIKSDTREDGMSIELSGDQIRDQWGKTIASDPFELRDDSARYENSFTSKDDKISIDIEVSGPEDEAEPVMAHLHDQTVRVLQAFENGEPPKECHGAFTIDWGSILSDPQSTLENCGGNNGE